MTDQELFDRVVDHMMTQQAKSQRLVVGSHTVVQCAYRGESCLKCAIGALIPDDQYDERMEGYRVFELVRWFPNLPFAGNNRELLDTLQGDHDLATVDNWEKSLRATAKRFGLQFNWKPA